jgi:hypothetical protein
MDSHMFDGMIAGLVGLGIAIGAVGTLIILGLIWLFNSYVSISFIR